MLHVYNEVIQPDQKDIMRYGAKYKLQKVTKMGDQKFYYFKSPDRRESLVAVPHFVKQYRIAETKITRGKKQKNYQDALRYVRANLNRTLEEDEMPDDESDTGITKLISLNYKDIFLNLEYKNKTLTLVPEFEIRKNNIFGNSIVVPMNLDMEG